MKIPDKLMCGISFNEYRPCYIITPHRSTPPTKERGFFHQWSCEQQPVGAGLAKGSHQGGQFSQTLGIVEKEDGSVCFVHPENIQFIDTRELMAQIAWDEEEEASKNATV